MTTPPRGRVAGRVAVLGAGPAGMAAALGAIGAGHDVVVYERYREARPAGNILNLWPPPLKALRALGVDTEDLGAPTDSEFRNLRGRVRVRVKLDEDVKREYGGGFIGLLRPELYERMLAAIPPGTIRFGVQVERIEQDDRAVTLHFADGSTAEHDVLVGADGIDSLVRRTLWGDAPKREHRLHIFGGFTFADVPGTEPNRCVLTHSATVQGSWTSIRNRGRDGHQWWVLTATDPDAPAPADLKAAATALAAGFPAPLPGLIAATDPGDVQRWVLRDRPALRQWSRGRATLVGDAAHPTSPYAAYGAGMSIEDGYFLGRALTGVDLPDAAAVSRALQSYEDPRKPHTARQVQQAYLLGKVFHHAPAPLRPLRDLVFDHTPFLQKVAGDSNPREINRQLALMTD
ncbi:FAD-dependent oxidoreductase [Geodermatophilus aquaeductus]|uniref:2-polyprenyl-6-methoxyphenol hydroxylase n=1 Tax=Geodermatophilus aquaeductus TaxID=1564161 RepID=A0A521E8N8_9ACTN|nr:NAD(P)/FAD-dependent oxidoreductase [Geodermatophilus aquaeductus]SMO80308.1 2-polyprenyl-6-methoxyphenol hydroxylase [Geodermatophilus aquaeductus]